MEQHIITACLVILALPQLAKGWRKFGNFVHRQQIHWRHVRSKLDAQ
jgi:hypothetical protein